MKIIRHPDSLDTYKKSAITIGAFDGVHLGHQSIIKRLKTIAKQQNLVPYIIFFEPLPKEYFAKNNIPKRLYSFRNKAININKFGIDNIICIRFNHKFTQITAEDFIEDFLVKKLNIGHIIIGDDFKFGKNRKGDFDLLKQYSSNHNFKVEKLSTISTADTRISSSLVRNALSSHNLSLARKFLGHDLRINGRIIHGQKNGRKLGFHTANIKLPKNSALKGVYLTKTHMDNKQFFSITNAGTRPTIDGKNNLLETHIFNFNQDIYGKHVDIEILEFIRPEIKFESFEQLKSQIQKDISTAKDLSKNFL